MRRSHIIIIITHNTHMSLRTKHNNIIGTGSKILYYKQPHRPHDIVRIGGSKVWMRYECECTRNRKCEILRNFSMRYCRKDTTSAYYCVVSDMQPIANIRWCLVDPISFCWLSDYHYYIRVAWLIIKLKRKNIISVLYCCIRRVFLFTVL